MRSLDVPFQPSATHQKGSSNSCWCVCACFILFCVLVLWSVRAKLTSSIHQVTWHVNVSSSQPGNLSSGRAQRTLVHMPPKVAPHGRKCLCELPKDVAVDYRHVHPNAGCSGESLEGFDEEPYPSMTRLFDMLRLLKISQHASFIFFPFVSWDQDCGELMYRSFAMINLKQKQTDQGNPEVGVASVKVQEHNHSWSQLVTVGHSRSQLQIWHQNRQAGLLLGWIEFRRWGVKP